jgi:hypothetical protein
VADFLPLLRRESGGFFLYRAHFKTDRHIRQLQSVKFQYLKKLQKILKIYSSLRKKGRKEYQDYCSLNRLSDVDGKQPSSKAFIFGLLKFLNVLAIKEHK